VQRHTGPGASRRCEGADEDPQTALGKSGEIEGSGNSNADEGENGELELHFVGWVRG